MDAVSVAAAQSGVQPWIVYCITAIFLSYDGLATNMSEEEIIKASYWVIVITALAATSSVVLGLSIGA